MLSYWNSRRIAAEFGRRDIAVSHGQVDRLLARSGTNRTSLTRVPGPRYERSSPNELWHMDLKGPFYLPTATGGLPRHGVSFGHEADDEVTLVPPGMPETMAGWDKVPLESVVDGRPAGVTDGPGRVRHTQGAASSLEGADELLSRHARRHRPSPPIVVQGSSADGKSMASNAKTSHNHGNVWQVLSSLAVDLP